MKLITDTLDLISIDTDHDNTSRTMKVYMIKDVGVRSQKVYMRERNGNVLSFTCDKEAMIDSHIKSGYKRGDMVRVKFIVE